MKNYKSQVHRFLGRGLEVNFLNPFENGKTFQDPADLEIHSSTTTTLASGGGAIARAMCPQKPGFYLT